MGTPSACELLPGRPETGGTCTQAGTVGCHSLYPMRLGQLAPSLHLTWHIRDSRMTAFLLGLF